MPGLGFRLLCSASTLEVNRQTFFRYPSPPPPPPPPPLSLLFTRMSYSPSFGFYNQFLCSHEFRKKISRWQDPTFYFPILIPKPSASADVVTRTLSVRSFKSH